MSKFDELYERIITDGDGVKWSQDVNVKKGKMRKLLAVPSDKITKEYTNVKCPEDLGSVLLNKTQHFFQHYKDLEDEKWVKVKGWKGVEAANKEIMDSFNNYNKANTVMVGDQRVPIIKPPDVGIIYN